MYLFGLFEYVVPRYGALPSVKARRNPFLGVGRREFRRHVKQPLESAITVERCNVEQQLSCLEREQERADSGDLLEPAWQVACHYHQSILQLPARLRCHFAVIKMTLV